MAVQRLIFIKLRAKPLKSITNRYDIQQEAMSEESVLNNYFKQGYGTVFYEQWPDCRDPIIVVSLNYLEEETE
jgi:hypothetical protein